MRVLPHPTKCLREIFPQPKARIKLSWNWRTFLFPSHRTWQWRKHHNWISYSQCLIINPFLYFSSSFSIPHDVHKKAANLQFRTLPRQQPQQQPHLGVNRNPNDSSALVSVIPSPSSFMSGSIMGHHTIRRSTQSGLVESLPPTSMATSMAGPGSFYNRNPTMAINTSQHQQFFYGWQQMSPLPSPVVPTSILKQSINYQKPVVYSGNIGIGCDDDNEKRETPPTSASQWVSFHLDKHDDDVCL